MDVQSRGVSKHSFENVPAFPKTLSFVKKYLRKQTVRKQILSEGEGFRYIHS